MPNIASVARHNLPAPPPSEPSETSLAPIRRERFGYEQARHLLLRAGFGGTDHQIRTLADWGPEKAVDHLVEYDSVPATSADADAFDRNIIRPLTEAERREYARARQARDEDTLARFRTRRQRALQTDRRQMQEIQRWWLKRMIQSPRPLEEKMTLFWHGHFATSFRVVEDSYHMYMQNRMLRGNALGHLGDLLLGIIRDPAMLRYLNNNLNRKDSPNENLARELFELFSLGEGNYSENDIKEAARTLTGFTYEDDRFVFNQRQHDTGSKFVLGARGAIDGTELVNAILSQSACAQFIATKLYRFFVRDIPMDISQTDYKTRRVVLELAQMLRRANYQLRPVIQRLFLSRHFYDAVNTGTKIKSPAELLVGAVRSLQVPVRDLGTIANAMELMGQSLFMPPSVKGWDGGRAWINTSTMFTRQNILIYMITGKLPTRPNFSAGMHHYDPTSVVSVLSDPDNPSPTPSQVAEELTQLTLGNTDPGVVASVAASTMNDAESSVRDPESLTRALVLLTSMPAYQLC